MEIGIRQGETGGPPLFASIFGNTVERNVPLLNRLGKGMFIFGAEYFQIFHYVGFLALVFGTIWRLPRLLAVPEFLVPCLFVLLHCVLILGLACNAGYLSNRHLLGVAVWGVFFSAAGFCDFPSRLVHWWRGKEWLAIFWSASEDPSTPTRSASERLPYRMSLVLLLAFIGLCLPRTTQKLHANQVGNHQAGLWLAKNLKNVDFIRDDHNWSFYYAGEIFAEPPHLHGAMTPNASWSSPAAATRRSRSSKPGRKKICQRQRGNGLPLAGKRIGRKCSGRRFLCAPPGAALVERAAVTISVSASASSRD